MSRSLKDSIDVYSAFIRNAFLKMLAYRLRYVTGILTYLLLVSVQYFIWNGVYSGDLEGEVVKGYALSEMITYIAIGWISRSFYFSNIDYEMDDLVRTGRISSYLIRPVNFQIMMFAQALGESLFRISFFSAPIALTILFVFPVMPPAGLVNAGLFALSTVFAFVILTQLNFLIGLLAFYLKSIQGIMRAKYYLIQLCSGLLLPLTFFPDWARTVLDFLPFKTVAYIPLQFYLGKLEGTAVSHALSNQIIWTAVLLIIGQILWQRALSKLTVQGG